MDLTIMEQTPTDPTPTVPTLMVQARMALAPTALAPTATTAMADMVNRATVATGRLTHTAMTATAAMAHSHLPMGAMVPATASLNPNTMTMAMAAIRATTKATGMTPMATEETHMATAAMEGSKHMAATPTPTLSHTTARPTGRQAMAMATRMNKHQKLKNILQLKTATYQMATVSRLWKQSTSMTIMTPTTQSHMQTEHITKNKVLAKTIMIIKTIMHTIKWNTLKAQN